MHMADALISPAVGGAMWLASAGLTAHASRKIDARSDGRLVPLMGVSGAFVFATQMINFGIPATGSSGHLGGGLFLAALLGPCPALVVMASILTIQSLFFADGGLLALGCNIFNLGVCPCLIAYPLVFRPLLGSHTNLRRVFIASLTASIVGVELGAAGVVIQTALSNRAELPFTTFLLLMLPIHLAIAVIEGLATTVILGFLWRARPDLQPSRSQSNGDSKSAVPVAAGLLAASLVLGGFVSWFASTRPDGLEWSVAKATGSNSLSGNTPVHAELSRLQEQTAILPDYGFHGAGGEPPVGDSEASAEHWPATQLGSSVSGIVGSLFVLVAACAIGFVSRATRPKREPS
jgi:cobalt/nickel transport system permease protein